MKKIFVALAAFGLAACVQAQLTFTRAPSVRYGAGAWTLSFGVSDTTDVEVTIFKAADSSIVRRLAAGRLGGNPPPPFTANSLTQTITWDGRDDLGARVDSALPLLVRVRAGMSVSFDRSAGQIPYYFAKILAVAFNQADGKLYVMGNNNALGGYGTQNKNIAIRQYGENGEYARTVFPCPAGLDTGAISPWIYYKRPDRSYCALYQTYGLPAILLAGSWLMHAKLALPYTVDKKLAMFSTDTFFLIDTNSAMATGKFLMRPPLGAVHAVGPDGRTWYFSAGRDIYRYTPWTGERGVWRTFPPEDSIQSPAGLAFDDSGRIFVCDRGRERVWVYDTASWKALGSVPARSPRQVGVSPSGEEIYFLGGTTGYRIWKYRQWRSPVCVDSTAAFPAPLGEFPKLFMKPRAANPFLIAATAGETGNILVFQDNGGHFTLVKDFTVLSRDVRLKMAPSVIDRPAVDRRTETVYFTSNFAELYKVVDWNTCKVLQCSTAARLPLWGGEAAVSPDGYLYVRQGLTSGSYSGAVTKWTTEYYHMTAKYGATGGNIADADVYGRSGDNFFGEKGIAVSRENKVADIPIIEGTWASYNLRVIDPADPVASRAAQMTHGVIHPLADHGAYMGALNVPNNVGNVKFDFDGNIYISTSLTAPGHIMPPGYVMTPVSDYRDVTVGAVYKFPPSGGSFTRTSAVGALKAYPQGLSIFSGGAHEWGIGCACRSPRFDLDPWGRLFIPHGLVCEIAVVDNNGNSILKFGGYGNADSRGPGSLVPLPEIGFITPQAVAASDNFIYVADPNTPSLVRIRMDFALDNLRLPIISVESGQTGTKAPEMACWPNPVNPAGHVAVALSGGGRVDLEVFDLRGRLVRRIYTGDLSSGRHVFFWNGSDARGMPVSAGVYVYRLAAGNRRLTVKTVLAR